MNETSTTISARKMTLTLFLSLFLTASFAQISLVTTNLRNDMLTMSVSDSDVQKYLNNMQANGSWSDIDYNSKAQTNWPSSNHAERLRCISIAYNKSSSAFYHQQTVKNKLLLGMRYYYNRKPTSTNWYYAEVEVAIRWGVMLIGMKTGDSYGFPQDTLNKYASVIVYAPSDRDGGANKIFKSKAGLYKGCIMENASMVSLALNNVADEISFSPGTDEGIKVDYTFYQHRQSIFNGGYATGFLRDAGWAINMTAGTTFALPASKVEILENLALISKWLLNKNVFDFGVSGRGISKPNGTVVSDLSTSLTQLINANGPRRNELVALKDYFEGRIDFPEPGNYHFWKGDMIIQHGANWYISARVSSSRVTATEIMNGENLKGKYVGITNTCVMTNGKEYRETQAVWDWSRIPGTTCENAPVAKYPSTYSTYINSGHSFSGGVSNGKYGFAAVNHTYDGVNGKKAYLLTEEGMYCIGGSISSAKSKIFTNIEQCLNQGTVTIDNGSTSTFAGTSNAYTNLNWVHQNNIGYYFPKNGSITVLNQNQSGNFYDINTTQSSTNITKKMFSIYFDHGDAPANKTYEYMIVPGKDAAQFKAWTSTSTYSTIANTGSLQALKYGAKGVYGVAFYAAGSVTLASGLTVSVNKPCLLLMETKNNGYNISVADPTQVLTGNIVVTVSKELSGNKASIENGSTSIIVDLPTGDFAGSTVSNNYIDTQLSSTAIPDAISDDRIAIKFYPNPVLKNNLLTIEFAKRVEKATIEILDENGKILDLHTINSERKKCIMTNYKAGLYFIRVKEGKNLITKKMVVYK
jgi:chondroitin AC lyase